ncbi:hypothetical protein [Streptosporangium jomthongense]|uniref:Uncharacterized protein n=1 Tax=Streptosporangium jomthongense TaxID=1193683 RepID=A0ABV8FD05_9ACTN
MRTAMIIPSLIVDEELYEAAAAGLAAHAPAQAALTWSAFTDASRWWLVPGPDDGDDGVPLGYKAEHVLTQTGDLTIKINLWYRPDLRSRETSKPHTHPWEVMEAHPVLGAYEDEHWHRTASGMLVEQGCVLNAPGSVNRIFARDYHEVTSIAAPGRTVSVMVCGRWIHDETRRGVWGHLDLYTGDHVPVQRDPAEQARFRSRLYRINPQHTTA